MSVFNQKATAGSTDDSTPPSEANHSGVLVAIIDLGTHSETYQDGKKADVHKIFFVFELDEDNDAGKHHVISKEATLTTSPKSTLRKIMEGLRGKAYAEGEDIDVARAIGRPGLVNVKHKTSSKGRVYAIFDTVAQLPKGMPAMKPTYETVIWEIGSGKPFPAHPWLPGSFLNGQFAPLKKIMEASHEMTGKKPDAPVGQHKTATAPVAAPSMEADEVPF